MKTFWIYIYNRIYRGYYMAARRYISLLEDKSHIFKPLSGADPDPKLTMAPKPHLTRGSETPFPAIWAVYFLLKFRSMDGEAWPSFAFGATKSDIKYINSLGRIVWLNCKPITVVKVNISTWIRNYAHYALLLQ